MWSPLVIALVVAFAMAFIVVSANIVAFSVGRGMDLIDYIYPYPQNHKPFKDNPATIVVHVLGNGSALLIGLAFVGGAETWFYAYLSSVTVGTLAGVAFSVQNPAHGAAATGSFAAMGAASLLPAWLAAQSAGPERTRQVLRSVAALWGAGVLFRVLALYALPKVKSGSERKLCWIAIIWASWWIPLQVVEVALAFSSFSQ